MTIFRSKSWRDIHPNSSLTLSASGLFPVSLCWQPDPHLYSDQGARETRY